MTLFRKKYRIESARLKDYDYASPGWYFVTICTKNREHYFGKIENGTVHFSEIGQIAEKFWLEIPIHFPHVTLDKFVIMPNHVHGIICILEKTNPRNVETQNFASLPPTNNENKFGPQSRNLASIIRGYKTGVKKWATINQIDFAWQSRFHDHIIRDEKSLFRIRHYINENPSNWIWDHIQIAPSTVIESGGDV